MINAKATISTKYGSIVLAFTEDDGVYMYVIVPDLMSGAYFVTALIFDVKEQIKSNEDLQEFVNESMPDVIEQCCDKVSRVRYLYEFGFVNKVDMSQPLEKGDYFIAVEKEYGENESTLSIIGVCDDGSSFLDEATVHSVLNKMEGHSYDDLGLPILEPGQITVTKFSVFRI